MSQDLSPTQPSSIPIEEKPFQPAPSIRFDPPEVLAEFSPREASLSPPLHQILGALVDPNIAHLSRPIDQKKAPKEVNNILKNHAVVNLDQAIISFFSLAGLLGFLSEAPQDNPKQPS